MRTDIPDHAALITQLGATKLAAALPALPVTVRAWTGRNRIPSEYWSDVIRFAATAGVEITAEWLMQTTPARANRAMTGAPELAA